MQEKDKAAAWDAFRTAWVMHPEIVWDDAFPPDARRVFQLAVEETKATEIVGIELVVPAPKSGFWLDGRAVAHGSEVLELFPGAHIFQWSVGEKIRTYRVTIPEGVSPKLAVPALVPVDFARWVAATRTQEIMSDILRLALPEGETVLVAAGGGVWKATIGTPGWEEVAEPTEKIEVDFPPRVFVDVEEVAEALNQTLPELVAESREKGWITLSAAPRWAKVGTPTLFAASVGLALFSVYESRVAIRADEDLESSLNAGDTQEAESHYEQRVAALRAAEGSRAVAAVGLVGAGIGAVVTVRFGTRGE
jgi:hypothetical protein